MTKTHIALVGGQPLPIYLGIQTFDPEQVILIHSEQTREEAERIATEVPTSTSVTFRLLDPVDLTAILKVAEDCAAKVRKTDTVSVNVSGGTKPWALAFFTFFSKLEQATVVYIDQNCRVWDFSTGINHLVEFEMDVLFRLYGNPLTDYTAFKDYTKQDLQMLSKVKRLRSFNHSEFYEVTKPFEKNPSTSMSTTKVGSSLQWDSSSDAFVIHLKNKKGKVFSERLSSPHIRQLLLNTGWFEYEVATVLAKWDKQKEIRMNCLFPTKNRPNPKELPKNEIDIIVDTGTKLLFVECKTQVYNNTDIDKFNSAVKNYGGMGSKAILITEGKLAPKAIEKCKDYDILHFSFSQEMLGQDPATMLFLLLNHELFNINPK